MVDSTVCSCIIPFYNEKPQSVVGVISVILKVKSISEIICVDDGSIDTKTVAIVKKKFKNVKVVRLEKNKGKADAIFEGLSYVKSDFVLLIDADLSNLKASEIEKSIEFMVNNPTVDMVILRRLSDPWFAKIIRGDVLTSGERILKRRDLQAVFKKSPPRRYQLEYAINFYFMKNKKIALWSPSTDRNMVKIYKLGIVRGIKKELIMYVDMLRYAGVILPLKSIFLFCRKSIYEYK